MPHPLEAFSLLWSGIVNGEAGCFGVAWVGYLPLWIQVRLREGQVRGLHCQSSGPEPQGPILVPSGSKFVPGAFLPAFLLYLLRLVRIVQHIPFCCTYCDGSTAASIFEIVEKDSACCCQLLSNIFRVLTVSKECVSAPDAQGVWWKNKLAAILTVVP